MRRPLIGNTGNPIAERHDATPALNLDNLERPHPLREGGGVFFALRGNPATPRLRPRLMTPRIRIYRPPYDPDCPRMPATGGGLWGGRRQSVGVPPKVGSKCGLDGLVQDGRRISRSAFTSTNSLSDT